MPNTVAGLVEAIRNMAKKIQKCKDGQMKEAGTKLTLIQPILEALDWNLQESEEEVELEFNPPSSARAVDYVFNRSK